MTSAPFVGREEELQLLLDAVTDCANGVVWDITGTNGIGKTALLRRVAEMASDVVSDRSRLVVVFRDLEDLDPDDSLTGFGAGIDAELLWYTFRQTYAVLSEAVRDLRERGYRAAFDDFIATAPGLLAESQAFVESHDLRRGDSSDNRQITEQILRMGIREQQARMDDLFIAAWSELTAGKTALVLLDHFEVVANDELGHWLVRLALRLPSTLTVVARVRRDIPMAVGQARYHQRELPLFTREQVSVYLRARLGDGISDEISAAVHDYIQGHVGGLVLATTLLERAPQVDVATVRRLIGRRPDEPDHAWSQLVHTLLDQVRDPTLRRAVDAATVLRTFDQPLLATLIGADVADEAIRVLSAHGLIRQLDGRGTPRFRMLEFVRQACVDDLRVLHPRVWLDMHGLAADHLFVELGDDFDDGGLFGRGFKYELVGWQSRMRDWLYHSGQLPERRQLTRARFALVFFEAFYWWGCYQKFDFNHDLVDDWERTVATSHGDEVSAELDQELTKELRFLLDKYPSGLVKTPDAPWVDIEDAILRIRELCGVAKGASLPKDPAEREQLSRIKGLLLLFAAQALRFQDLADDEIDALLAESVRLYRGVGDRWMVAWLYWEHASIVVDRRDRTTALALLADAAGELVGLTVDGEDEIDDEFALDWDYELIAELHRLIGDLELDTGSDADAAVAYGRAAAAAYWVQGQPHPPDAYTQRYFQEVTTALLDRILTIAATDQAAGVAFAEALRERLGRLAGQGDLAAAVAAADADALRTALLPRGPAISEIGSGDSPFMREWNRHWNRNRIGPLAQLQEIVMGRPDS